MSRSWGVSYDPWSMGDCGIRIVTVYSKLTGEEITRYEERKPCTNLVDPIGQ